MVLFRDMPRAIVIGISLTTVCYLLVNVAYITVLGASGILASDAVAVVSFKCRDFNGLLYTKVFIGDQRLDVILSPFKIVCF